MTTSDIDLSTPEALMRSFSACLNRGDLDGLVALYEPGAVFVPRPGVVVHGQAAIRDALGQLLTLAPCRPSPARRRSPRGFIAWR
jgi:ketosteroid isomerase-like protein